MAAPTKAGSRPRCVGHGEGGLSYIGLLIALAIVSALLAATTEVWVTAQRRENERELLFIGSQFRQALASYDKNTPGSGAQSQPKNLEDLVKDPRYPTTKRYLRKIYVDPMTNTKEWGLLRGPDGGIIGIFSTSDREPLKKKGFSRQDAVYENKNKYSEWIFAYGIGQVLPGVTPQASPDPLGRSRSGR